MSKTLKSKIEALKAKLKKSKELPERTTLQQNIIDAFDNLPNELQDNLISRANRFFSYSDAYQQKHLNQFIDNIVKTIDHYVVPADVDNDGGYNQIRNDVLANIALALVSLLIFYPLVLAVTSYKKGQNYGFFRVNDKRNDVNKVDGITFDQDAKSDETVKLKNYKKLPGDDIIIVRVEAEAEDQQAEFEESPQIFL